jgi:hypothetical protein
MEPTSWLWWRLAQTVLPTKSGAPERPCWFEVFSQPAKREGRKTAAAPSSSKNPRRQGPVLVDQEMFCSGPCSAGGDLPTRDSDGGITHGPRVRTRGRSDRTGPPSRPRPLNLPAPSSCAVASKCEPLAYFFSISSDMPPELISGQNNHPDFVHTAYGLSVCNVALATTQTAGSRAPLTLFRLSSDGDGAQVSCACMDMYTVPPCLMKTPSAFSRDFSGLISFPRDSSGIVLDHRVFDPFGAMCGEESRHVSGPDH